MVIFSLVKQDEVIELNKVQPPTQISRHAGRGLRDLLFTKQCQDKYRIPTMATQTIRSILAAEPWYYSGDRQYIKFRVDGTGEVRTFPIVAKRVRSTPADLGRTRNGLYLGRKF
ncbi:hypothetical protein N7492_010689 [Penicillium capsulatum]|uniref:Uncharacterized protein n=1 Tax=Penicillium capsulatum TaxID=69766 RepID=A0A9W9LF58_9EURO|nr:hypothetical protein N7492_010689 [Penicillium capsulatum]KAJ6103534.1 hypothetical protein N7512_010614 [Penicillium capsulatum]KAJ6113187.1 hypothetical protein N7512_008511 [Penicillium capsulatum]